MFAARPYVAKRLAGRVLLTMSLLYPASRCPADDVTVIQYGSPRELCKLSTRKINESSGLAISRLSNDRIWTHNDSGDEARIYCINWQGEHLGTCKLKKIKAVDWEDMCSYVIDGRPKLLLADVGDNGLRRKSCRLNIVDEPADPTDDRSKVQVLRFRYATGPTDCEAVAVDPVRREVLLIEKKFALTCRVFVLPLPTDDQGKDDLIAKPIARITVPLVTAADVSPDGLRAMVLTLGQAFEFTRRRDQTWADVFRAPPRVIDMPARRQGEAICYAGNGRDLLLTSELTPTPLFLVPAHPVGEVNDGDRD